jgi:hypothetical protein
VITPSLRSLERRATIVIFTGNSCPTVRAYEDRLMALRARREQDGVLMVAVNPNNPHLSPSDTLAEMVHRAAQRHFNFPYLKDADGAVAKAFGATCTPHAFVVNADGEVVYSGRIDDSRVGDRVTSEDLENAVDDIVAGRNGAQATRASARRNGEQQGRRRARGRRALSDGLPRPRRRPTLPLRQYIRYVFCKSHF